MSPQQPPFAAPLAALGWDAPSEPRDPNDRPSYVGPVSFAQLPWIEDPKAIARLKADIAIVGAPFDDAVTHRPGTRFGPRAIREAQYQTGQLHSLQLGVDPFVELVGVDAGDAAVVPGRLGYSHGEIYRKVREGYLMLARSLPHRFRDIDGLWDEDTVADAAVDKSADRRM